MDAVANNVNERNIDPTRMDDIKPKTIDVLKEMFMRDENPNADDSQVNRFLRLIRETGSVIAGGFLLHALHDEDQHNNHVRPWSRRYNQMNHPDIDIYVPIENAYRFMQQLVYGSAVVVPILGEYHPTIGSFKATLYCQSFLRRNGIQTIHNIYIEQDGDGRRADHNFEMDIMIVRSNRTPIQVANNFDLTFCQVWFDGENVYASHPEDVRNKSGTLQGDYVNLFVQGNEFLQKRLKKYQGRGYEIRLDPVRMEEIAGNALSTMPICREESRKTIMTHWTSRVIMYWLLGVRNEFIEHDEPLTPSLSHVNIMAVPLLLHQKSLVKGTAGDHFISAHRYREVYNKDNYPQDLNGYDSEDYKNDESLYPVLGTHYNQDWDADQQKLEYFRETNKLIEMIMWPNQYRIPLPGGRRYDQHETMGAIFEYAHQDDRKASFRPFYDALRTRCIRRSNQPYAGYNSNAVNDEFSEVFDIHHHPLNRASTAEHIEAYLRASHMTRQDKNTTPCYNEGCIEPLTLSQIKYIVSIDFYNEYTRPPPVRRGLDQVIEIIDAIKENTATVDPVGYGTLYHDSICPFCLQPISRSEGCMYLTHSKVDDFHPEAPFCQTRFLIREIYDKYRNAARDAVNADDFGPFHLKLELCAQCGRPCNTHHHFPSAAPYDRYLAGLGQGRAEYGLCPGQGRAELFARILAIREVYRANNGINSMEERRLAAIAADDAPNNEALMARGEEILAMEPAERVWGNAELPREKHYTNEAYQENGANAENENAPQNNAARRQRIIERYRDLEERLGNVMDGDNLFLTLPISDALREIGEIVEPEFAEVQNLDHYEEELDRIERMIEPLELEQNGNLQGGRFNRSRKKQVRRKQKTLRSLLKKLK